MKVYVVAEGCYSDYHIESIFSTRKQARNYVINRDRLWNEWQIEEYELDDEYPETNDKLFEVEYRDGMWKAEDADRMYYSIERENRASYYKYDIPPTYTYHNYVHARDKKHAIKICQDDYAMLKAEKVWE